MRNKPIFLLFFFAIHSVPVFAGTRYYLDSASGNDGNSGNTPGQAWKTLAKITSTVFQPGDSILFKSGGVWNGQMSPKGSGAEGKPIVIGQYGNADKPVLNGEGSAFVILLSNQEYWDIGELEITNVHPTQSATMKRAVWIKASDFGTVHAIRLHDLYVHDVNGSNDPGDASTSKYNGGFIFEITGGTKPTWFDGVVIENCRLDLVSRTGITLLSSWDERSFDKNTNWTPSRNVVIRNNTVERTGGNGLIWRVSHRPLVEHNLFRECATELSGNALFFFNCDSALAQYNEACYTVFKDGETDAAGFDADYRCKNTVMQYNYSHDNGQGGFVVCTMGTSATAFQDGATIRYNILQNNARETFHLSGPLTNTRIYNNVIYLGPSLSGVKIVYHKSWGGYPSNTSYRNNIFYVQAPNCSYSFGSSTGNLFDCNVFFGQHPAGEPFDAHKLTSDPLFVNPGGGEMGLESLKGYQLRTGSPCINAGLKQADQPSKDFWGNTVPDSGGKVDRGAHEFGSATQIGRETEPGPHSIRLSQNYPNPFNSDTVIAYEIGANAVADVAVYDSNGRKVKTLIRRSRMPAKGLIHWRGDDDSGSPVSAGVYCCCVLAGDRKEMIKMVYVR